MIQFTIAAYDKDTHDSISDAMHGERGVYSICHLDQDTSWREIRLIAHTLFKSLASIDAPTAVGLAIINNKDTIVFHFDRLNPAAGTERRRLPVQEAEQIYEELTTTEVRLNKGDIHLLMNLLPQGNGAHSEVREKLHQGDIAINKKR